VPDWEREHLTQVRTILASEEWVALPTHFDVNEWSMMQGFARSVADEALRDELMDAIHGAGAFRHFKDTIYRYGIEDRWYAYKAEAIAGLASDWLRREGIEFDADVRPLSPGETPN
jgi:hypothetical protein